MEHQEFVRKTKLMASISKRILPSGKPQWRVSYMDANGRRKRPGFSSWTEADKYRQEIEEQLRKGLYRPDADRITVKEVCSGYLEYAEGRMQRDERMTRKMLTVYKGHINKHVLSSDHGIGSRKLSRLTSKAVGDFRDALRSSGVTVSTTRKIISTLHAILAYAIGQDWIAANAAHGVRVIGPRNEGAKKIVPPSKSELKAILDAADDAFRFAVLFAASTGVRAGEQWALTWGDVDFDVGTLNISQRMDSYGDAGPPKSVAGVRSIPLSSQMLTMLKQRKLAAIYSGQGDYIFPNKRGKHTGHDNMMKRQYKPTLARAGVSGVNWHSLRHFTISTWIEAGITPKTVQTFAGHSSLSVTMDRYGHLFPSDDHKLAMDGIAGELMG
jgi:integrase